MDVASIMEAWYEAQIDAESEDSEGSVESEEHVAAQEFFDDTSDDEDICSSNHCTAPGLNRTTHSRAHSRPVEYYWQEVNAGKECLQDV
jgi:hypothetical protein